MQFINLEVVIAVLIFVGLIAFIALVYTSMRALIGKAAHAIAFVVGQASNIFRGSRPSHLDSNQPPLAAPGEKPNTQDKR